MTIDGKNLSTEELKGWIREYFAAPRRVFSYFVNPEKKALIEQNGDDEKRREYLEIETALQKLDNLEQITGERIKNEGIKQGRDLHDILADIFNIFSDMGREIEYSEKRAPAPSPVDSGLFSKTVNEISDDDFFEIIWKNPAYLGAVFALGKIGKWRREMYASDQEIATNAKDMLKKIGTTLARQSEKPGSGTHYKEGVPSNLVLSLYSLIYNDLTEKGVTFNGEKQFAELQAYAQKTFNIMLDDSDENNTANDATDVFRNRNLAAYLTGKVFGLKTTGVLEYLK